MRSFVLPAILGLTLLTTGCDYLPKSASLELTDAQKSELKQHLKPAKAEILTALQTHQFIALGDAHYYQGYMPKITELVTKADIVEQVNTVVVEFGNQKYQSWINTYLAGETGSDAELKNVLRETIYFTAWLADDYFEFFKAVRDFNTNSAHTKKIKVILAESYFDWQSTTQAQQWETAAHNKVAGFFEQVKPLITEKQKAILIFGGFHLFSSESKSHSLIDKIERQAPNSTYAVWPMIQPILAEQFVGQEAGIINTHNTPLAHLAFADIMPKARAALSNMNMRGATANELIDGFMYIGENKRDLKIPDSMRQDTAWIGEMKRRVALIGGRLEKRFNSILEAQ